MSGSIQESSSFKSEVSEAEIAARQNSRLTRAFSGRGGKSARPATDA
jgi:hypothetical protein